MRKAKMRTLRIRLTESDYKQLSKLKQQGKSLTDSLVDVALATIASNGKVETMQHYEKLITKLREKLDACAVDQRRLRGERDLLIAKYELEKNVNNELHSRLLAIKTWKGRIKNLLGLC